MPEQNTRELIEQLDAAEQDRHERPSHFSWVCHSAARPLLDLLAECVEFVEAVATCNQRLVTPPEREQISRAVVTLAKLPKKE